MNEDQIKQMAQRFLGWKLPKPFRPDNFISFVPPKPVNPGTPYENDLWPTGTNLFGYTEAVEMVRYMVEGLAHGETVAWIYWPTPENQEPPFSQPNRANMDPRYWIETPIRRPARRSVAEHEGHTP